MVTALQDARNDIEPFLTMPWDVYCRNMQKSGTWGGSLLFHSGVSSRSTLAVAPQQSSTDTLAIARTL